jgi:hypothetical protein
MNLFDFLLWEAIVLLKNDGKWVADCDSCSENIETSSSTWDEALQEIKAAGWRSAMKDGAWAHLCPSCYEARRKDNPIGPNS